VPDLAKSELRIIQLGQQRNERRPRSVMMREASMAERLITDIGGLSAGPVPRDDVPQLFWEKQMMAMFNVLRDKGVLNLDEFRRVVEEMPVEAYQRSTFYGRRLDGITDLLVEKSIIDREELNARTVQILRAGTRDHAG
jgi:hypothetical protein